MGKHKSGTSRIEPLTGHAGFDTLISRYSTAANADTAEEIRKSIWQRFGTKGAVFISDMAGFSSTSREVGVCHFLKLIHRARQLVGPLIDEYNGTLLKCEADNCYAFFAQPDDAIQASFAINAALFDANRSLAPEDHVYLSVGIDYGRLLLIGDADFYGDPVNTASKLGEDLAIHAETLVTERALQHSTFEIPENAERMVARISEIEIEYVRLRMTEPNRTDLR